jgi:hypothetical protein
VTPEQIAVDYNEQPEPHDKCEHRKHIHQEISIGEAFLKEEHRNSPLGLKFDPRLANFFRDLICRQRTPLAMG